MQSANLNYIQQGDGPAVLIAHGLFGSMKNWQSLAKALATEFSVITVDLRNHGDSPHLPEMSYAAMAQDIIDLLDRLNVDRVKLVGHSMGGKVVMKVTQMEPGLTERQIVADIAPRSYTHDYDHVFGPLLRLDLSRMKQRREVDQALEKEISDPALRAFLLQSLRSTPEGLSWKLNLPVLNQYIGEIIGFEPIDDWSIEAPTLFLHGALSNYVDDAAQRSIKQHFSMPRFHPLENAGHWLHADQPKAFLEVARDFLKEG